MQPCPCSKGGVRAVQRLCVCMCTPLYRNHMLVYCICIVFFFVFFFWFRSVHYGSRGRERFALANAVSISFYAFPCELLSAAVHFCFFVFNPLTILAVSFSSLSPLFPLPLLQVRKIPRKREGLPWRRSRPRMISRCHPRRRRRRSTQRNGRSCSRIMTNLTSEQATTHQSHPAAPR